MNVNKLIELGKQGNMKALEQEREKMVQELLNQVTDPDQLRRLKQLHFKVKNLRYKYKNPLVACVKVNEMMMESLRDLNVALHQLTGELNEE